MRVDVGRPTLAGTLARMQQHVLDDGVGALAVLHDLFEIAFQHLRQLADLAALLLSSAALEQALRQFVDQLGRQRREIIDEVERVLDLVRDAGRKLAERGELLRLHQAVLRSTQIVKGSGKLFRACLHLVEQADVLDGDHSLIREASHQLDLAIGNGRTCCRVRMNTPMGAPSRNKGIPNMVR